MAISGGPELAAALRELGDMTSKTTAKNRLAAGMVKASLPMVLAAQNNAPKDEFSLATENIVASKSLSARQKREAGKVPKTSVRTYVGERGGSTVGLLNEIGTDLRQQTTTGRETGQITPRPWLRPAFDSTAQAVLNGIVPHVRAEVDKAAKSAAKKHARKAARSAAASSMRAAALARLRRA